VAGITEWLCGMDREGPQDMAR